MPMPLNFGPGLIPGKPLLRPPPVNSGFLQPPKSRVSMPQFDQFALSTAFNDDRVAKVAGGQRKISNIVATAWLKDNHGPADLDLKSIALKCRNTQYNPRKFPALIMRLREPVKATALIFRNGKMVITGASTEQQASDAGKHFARIVRRNQTKHMVLNYGDFKVQNIVASTAVENKISLLDLADSKHRAYCEYNPEAFPGLIYRLWKDAQKIDGKTKEKCICFQIFASGRINVTGA